MTDFFEERNVLVTGGSGMIGVQLVDLLLQAGANVRVASLDDPSWLDPRVEFMKVNLMEWENCRAATKGMDYVFHVAGIKGSVGIGSTRAASFLVPHLLMNTLTMEAARQAGVSRYLFTSSVAVYPPAERFVEDDAWSGPPHQQDRYAAWAKRMGELQAEAYMEEYGWGSIAIVRPANVYGPFDNFDPTTAMVIPALIRRVIDGENPLVVWGDGSAVRDFIYSADVAEGMMLALEHGADCEPVNLGSGKGASIKELVESIVSVVPDPPEVVWDTSKASGESVRLMDMTRAKEKLGFEAATTLEDGVKKTIAWFLDRSSSGEGRYSVFRESSFLS